MNCGLTSGFLLANQAALLSIRIQLLLLGESVELKISQDFHLILALRYLPFQLSTEIFLLKQESV